MRREDLAACWVGVSMSFRGGGRRGFNRGGRGGGYSRGGSDNHFRGGGSFRGGGGRGFGRGGGRGGFNRGQDQGPPEHVVCMSALKLDLIGVLGEFLHPCEDDIVCKCTTNENKVPYFNAPVYLENKEQIGKVDEIFGQLRDFVSFLIERPIKLSENMKASSFKKLQKVRRALQEVVSGAVEEEEEEVAEAVEAVVLEVEEEVEASEEEEGVVVSEGEDIKCNS
ncbi:hypothetical protein MC885_002702 [Smutsia gigantea]|nr:hypothetical protein MC885_002702 [Smutsia gigantea]